MSIINSLIDTVSNNEADDYEDFLQKYGVYIPHSLEAQQRVSYQVMFPFFNHNHKPVGYYLPLELGTDEKGYGEIIFDSYNKARYALKNFMVKGGTIMVINKWTHTKGYYPSLYLDLQKTENLLRHTQKSLGLPYIINELERNNDLWT